MKQPGGQTAETSAEIEADENFGRRIGTDTLRFERRLNVPTERVWRALVSAEGLGAWLGQVVLLEPRAGGRLVIRFDADSVMDGAILEFAPNRRLVLAWREGARDESNVSFELAPDDAGGTHFSLTHRYIRAGEETIDFGAGWHSHLNALTAWLANGAGLDCSELFDTLKPIYAKRFA
jgi:uncharacterized protein YndB with AHSA1/START domain